MVVTRSPGVSGEAWLSGPSACKARPSFLRTVRASWLGRVLAQLSQVCQPVTELTKYSVIGGSSIAYLSLARSRFIIKVLPNCFNSYELTDAMLYVDRLVKISRSRKISLQNFPQNVSRLSLGPKADIALFSSLCKS